MADLVKGLPGGSGSSAGHLVRKPTARIIRIQHNGRMTAATIVARRTLTAVAPIKD
jgi:hypothetical protein